MADYKQHTIYEENMDQDTFVCVCVCVCVKF